MRRRRFGRVYAMGLVASYKMKAPLRRGTQDVLTGFRMMKRGKPGLLPHKIQNVAAIRRMAGRKTVIVASHRLAAVRFADAIVSLEQGRVAEQGAHDSLVAAQGYYAQVHRLQELDHAV